MYYYQLWVKGFHLSLENLKTSSPLNLNNTNTTTNNNI